MLAGALLVLASAAQASAQPESGINRAIEGVAIGLAAASEVAGEGDVIVVDENLIDAWGVYDVWSAKHAAAGRTMGEQGPANAQEVHEALLARGVPGQLKKQDSKLSGLSGVYEMLKGKSDEAKQAKEDKVKSNSGKSDGKSQADKNKSESAKGQQNRP